MGSVLNFAATGARPRRKRTTAAELSKDDRHALTWLSQQPGGAVKMSAAEFGRHVGWSRQKAARRLDALTERGLVVRRAGVITLNRERTIIRTEIIREAAEPAVIEGRTDTAETPAPQTEPPGLSAAEIPPDAPASMAAAEPAAAPEIPAARPSSNTSKGISIMGWFSRKAAAASPAVAAPDVPAPAEAGRLPRYESRDVQRGDQVVYARPAGRGWDAGPGFDVADSFGRASTMEKLLLLIALALSATAAWVSVHGMATLYPSGGSEIMVFGTLIEAAKFVGFGVVAAGWARYSMLPRLGVAGLLVLAALVNAAAVYGWLCLSHTGPMAQRTATYAVADAGQGAKAEMAQTRLADVQQRIRLIDEAAEGAARRGRSRSAIAAMRQQAKDREALVAERDRLQGDLSAAKTGQTELASKHQIDEAAALPVRYSALLFEDLGLLKSGADPERLIRWISAMILLCGDPLALACMVMINSRTRKV